jgi:hypothetical protein
MNIMCNVSLNELPLNLVEVVRVDKGAKEIESCLKVTIWSAHNNKFDNLRQASKQVNH